MIQGRLTDLEATSTSLYRQRFEKPYKRDFAITPLMETCDGTCSPNVFVRTEVRGTRSLRRSLGARFRMSSKCAVYHRFLHNIVYHLGPRFRMSSSCVACHRFLNKTSRKSLYRSSRSIMALCTNSIAEEAVRQAAALATIEARWTNTVEVLAATTETVAAVD